MSTHEADKKGRHASFGDRIKGAAHVVHGLGENIRGSVMGAVESVSGSEGGKAREDEIVSKGRFEVEQGIAQLQGGEPGSKTVAPEPQVPAQGQVGGHPQPPQPGKEQMSGTAQAPVPTPTHGAVGTETRQDETETMRQEPAGQTDPLEKQTGSSYLNTETVSPQTGDLVAEGANAPQGPA